MLLIKYVLLRNVVKSIKFIMKHLKQHFLFYFFPVLCSFVSFKQKNKYMHISIYALFFLCTFLRPTIFAKDQTFVCRYSYEALNLINLIGIHTCFLKILLRSYKLKMSYQAIYIDLLFYLKYGRVLISREKGVVQDGSLRRQCCFVY